MRRGEARRRVLERRDGRAGAESDELGRLSHAEADEELGPGDGSELPVDGALRARLVPLLNPLDVLPHRLRAARQCACGAVAPSLLSRCGERHTHNEVSAIYTIAPLRPWAQTRSLPPRQSESQRRRWRLASSAGSRIAATW